MVVRLRVRVRWVGAKNASCADAVAAVAGANRCLAGAASCREPAPRFGGTAVPDLNLVYQISIYPAGTCIRSRSARSRSNTAVYFILDLDQDIF